MKINNHNNNNNNKFKQSQEKMQKKLGFTCFTENTFYLSDFNCEQLLLVSILHLISGRTIKIKSLN